MPQYWRHRDKIVNISHKAVCPREKAYSLDNVYKNGFVFLASLKQA